MYVVTGATGNTGSVVAERLLAAGKRVRVVVRSVEKAAALAKRGAEVAVADLTDERALEKAFEGARGLYLLAPPDLQAKSFLADCEKLTAGAARAIGRAGVEHVVLLSSIGAELPSGTGPIVSVYNAERQLREAGVPSTFVRAAYFLENWASVLPVAAKDGVLPAFFPADLRIPMVATRDIGEVAAQALLEGPRGVRVIDLAGPEDLSPNDVARAVGELLRRDVRAAEAPLDAVIPTMTSFGISAEFAALYRELYGCVRSGRLVWHGEGQAVRGKTGVAMALRPLLSG